MTYFMDYKKMYEELNMLSSFSPDVKVQQSEQMAIMGPLINLPSKYDALGFRFCLALRYHNRKIPSPGYFAQKVPHPHLPAQLSSALVNQDSGEPRKQQFKNSIPRGDTREPSFGGVVLLLS